MGSSASRPELPPEIQLQIASLCVETSKLDHESWLLTRNVCRLFKRLIEDMFYKHYVPRIELDYNRSDHTTTEGERVFLEKYFSFEGLDRHDPSKAIFRESSWYSPEEEVIVRARTFCEPKSSDYIV